MVGDVRHHAAISGFCPCNKTTWSCVVFIYRLDRGDGRGSSPEINGSFLAKNQCGGRERGAFLASGCEPRFARFAVRTRQFAL